MAEVASGGRGHPRLSSPPLVEGIFEFRAKSPQPYTLLPGQLATRLAERYPSVKELEAAKIAAIAELPLEAGLLVTHRIEESDGQRLVQLGVGGFSINFKRYSGYDEFRAEIDRVTKVYFELADVQEVHRLGLRYINFVEPKPEPFSAFTTRIEWPSLPDAVPDSLAARQILQYQDPSGQLAVVIGSPDPRGSLLDFDFYSSPGSPMTVEAVLSWADRAHERIYEAFRGMVRADVFAGWSRSSLSEAG